jgi:phage terminase large subunit
MANRPVIYQPPDLFNDYVGELAARRDPLMMVRGGAGAGKSVAVAQIALHRAMKEGQNGIAFRKHQEQARKSVFPLLKSLITQSNTSRYWKIGLRPMRLTYLPNGAQIWVEGAADPEALKSITNENGVFTWAWLEETSEFTPADLREIRRRLRGLTPWPKQVWLTFNPVSELHWLKTELVDKNAPGLYERVLTHPDNKFLTQSDRDVLEELKFSNPHDYQIYTLGQWGTPHSGLVYNNFALCSKAEFEALPGSCERILGVDFGYTAPTAVCEYKLVHRSGRLPAVYARELLYKEGLLNQELISFLKPLAGGAKIYCDCAEPSRIEGFRRAGLRAFAWEKDVKASTLFTKGIDLFVCGDNFINELSQYRWSDREADRPGQGTPDHLVDTLRGAVWSHLRRHPFANSMPLSYKKSETLTKA